MTKLLNRFLRYVQINTQSDDSILTCPSSAVQLVFAGVLAEELNDLGLNEISLDENGYVMASLSANIDDAVPVIGFIAHMDTSPDVSGESVKPGVHRNYDGNNIILNDLGIVLAPQEFPELLKYKGQTLITSDGTTLLGADDKAGIAEIMTALEWMHAHPEFKHGTIKIAFTPDEEIGRGADLFAVEKFGADFAYTVDGGEVGELEYENFNAAGVTVSIQGRNVHPGSAKNTMRNALLIAMELNGLLPVSERPEFTEGREGFYHLTDLSGCVEEASMKYIIRDHSREKFAQRKQLFENAVNYMNQKYGLNTITLEIQDQYYNMQKKIQPVMYIVDLAEQAMQALGIEPIVRPIRGGTDGARLSYMGLPCPNLFTGGHNFHSKYEYIPLESMQKAVQLILKIIELSLLLPVSNSNS